jgi:putative hemolysin
MGINHEENMDSDPLIWQIILQIALILVNAFFACAEIAVISISDSKLALLAAGGDKRALRLQKLASVPSKFLATIQVGITFAGFLGSAFAAGNFAERLVQLCKDNGVRISEDTLRPIMIIAITILLSYFTLVLGELVPKRLAMQKPETIGLALSGIILVVAVLFKPVVWLLTKSTNGILRLMRIDPNAEDEEVTEEEIRMMVDAGTEKGTIDQDEKYIIHNVFEFDNKTADEVMTHRVEVVLLWLEESDEEWEKMIIDNRHSHYPVCEGTSDNIKGVLIAKDYFRLKDRSREHVLKTAVTPAQFVPESVRTDILFHNMKVARNHFAVVLDEYGGMSGIVTMNDLLEELVGDLEDDAAAPVELPLIEMISPGVWRVDCSVSPEEAVTAFGIRLPDEVFEENDTFAGVILNILGRVPDDGETLEVTDFGLRIKVTEIKEHRIEQAVVALAGEEADRAE